MVVPHALKCLRLKPTAKHCVLGRLSAEVGWKYHTVVSALEEKRIAKAAEYFKAKKAEEATKLKLKA